MPTTFIVTVTTTPWMAESAGCILTQLTSMDSMWGGLGIVILLHEPVFEYLTYFVYHLLLILHKSYKHHKYMVLTLELLEKNKARNFQIWKSMMSFILCFGVRRLRTEEQHLKDEQNAQEGVNFENEGVQK